MCSKYHLKNKKPEYFAQTSVIFPEHKGIRVNAHLQYSYSPRIYASASLGNSTIGYLISIMNPIFTTVKLLREVFLNKSLSEEVAAETPFLISAKKLIDP